MRIALTYAVFALAFVAWVYVGWPQVFGFPPKPQAVEAANTPGDYIIRRNNADAATLTTTATTTQWDTAVASNGSSISYSAGDFTLASGKYLILYSESIDSDSSDTTNNERIEVQSRIVIGGVATSTAAGQAYMRAGDGSCGSDCQYFGVVAGSGIIDIPSDSTTVSIQLQRTDDQAGDRIVIRDVGWGGVSILALDDTWNYARYITTSTQAANTSEASWADVSWDLAVEEDTGFSQTAGDITITNAGRYLVTYALPLNGATARTEYESRLTLNGSEVEGTTVSTYMRSSDSTNDGVLSYVGVIDVSASDVLSVENIKSEGTSSTFGAGIALQILQLPAGNETFIANATTGGINFSTATEFSWDSTPHIDTAGFTDTSATDSIIEPAEDGDYLFFFTQKEDDGATSRAYPTARISVNDTIQTHGGAAGEYCRNSGTADDCGFSAGILLTGLTAGDDISVENLGTADNNTGTVTSDHGAFSGIRLSSLFGGGGGGGGGGLTLTGNVLFGGNLTITGAISKGSGTFAIDHPLDPENQILFHSFVESPDVKNVYDGIAELDESGEATIELPDYFMALNKDFRYQFLALDESQPDLYIKNEIIQNRFTIAGGAPNGRVSWQITGIRHDPYIVENPIIVEVEKGPDEIVDKGEYIFSGYEQ